MAKSKAAASSAGAADHAVRVGVGGWIYEPWRDNFYPAGLPHRRELEFASRKLTAIEINGTFYRSQPAAVFEKWAAETPAGFKFTVKAQRFTTSRKTADEMREAIQWFVGGGVLALGDRLGAINWQFAPTRKFDADYFSAFLGALPREQGGLKLRHAIEVRHASFRTPQFEDLLRANDCALVFSDEPGWPMPDAETADFAYARLQCSRADEPLGYPKSELRSWAETFRSWAAARDVFAFFISGAKEHDPAGAMALQDLAGVAPAGFEG